MPKTISGKIRRVDLRVSENVRVKGHPRGAQEFWEEDFLEVTRVGVETRDRDS